MATQTFVINPTVPPRFKQTLTEQQRDAAAKVLGFENVQAFTEADTQYKGAFGHAILQPFVFEASTGRLKTENGEEVITTEELFLPVCLMDVAGGKVTVRTPVQGRDGTVKETGDLDDYKITIRGILFGADGAYPTEDRNKLINIGEFPFAVEVANELLNDGHAVYTVADVKVTWLAMEGIEGAAAFQLECYSDTAADFIIDDEL